MSTHSKRNWLFMGLFAASLAAGCGSSDAAPACGDGTVDADEACDDGNTVDGDGCSMDCSSDETCGNDVVDPDEACDDGNTVDGDGCSMDCSSDETCGNDVVDPGEVCDDGNTEAGDGCSMDCMSDETCGNDVVDPDEACDDGNTVDGDGCSMDCSSDETCGNEIVDPGEECDDGNADETDGCLSTCEITSSCLHAVTAAPSSATGIYVIDPDGADGEASFDAFCDMETDGGGWTLLTWTGDSSTAVGTGVPYPGLIPCSTLDCLRGSAMGDVATHALFEASTEFGLGHDTTPIASYTTLGAYMYAGKYNYGSLSGLLLNYGATSCGSGAGESFATGTFSTLAGPADFDGTTVYVSQALSYASYDYSADTNSYIFSLGVTSSYCSGSGAQPGNYLGTYFSPTGEQEYGPYLASTVGARSVWVR